ncbi:hypothetical protein JCM10213_008374 [Rhodosporidiobolus nylandii]
MSSAPSSSSESVSEDNSRQPDPVVPMLACERESPRPCINQALVDALAPIRAYRFLKFGTQHEKSIAYATAISAIIGAPFKIETVKQARKLPKIGEKIITKVDEFLRHGYIQESRDVVEQDDYKTLALLQTINGIGYHKANELYEQGIRTLDDLVTAHPEFIPRVRYHHHLQQKIPRSEVESIMAYVKLQLDKVQPGSHLEACGGYRRGKEFSNDVDILITWPHNEGAERGVLKKLVKRLQVKGFIPPDGLLGASEAGSQRIITANRPATQLDALDKALIIFRHPPNGTTRPEAMFRRVDLVVSNWENWGCALVGWTGSTQFERDLRRYCKTRDIRFDSGGLRNELTDEVIRGDFSQEKEVFRYLDLPWLPPHVRNADP